MVLDTSSVVDLLRDRAAGADGPAAIFLSLHRNATVSLPLFARCELELGAERSSDPQRERIALREITDLMTPIDPAPGFEVVYARVVSALLASGTPIPLMDALIGTLALQYSRLAGVGHAWPLAGPGARRARRGPAASAGRNPGADPAAKPGPSVQVAGSRSTVPLFAVGNGEYTVCIISK